MSAAAWKTRKDQVDRYFDQKVKRPGIAGFFHRIGRLFARRIPSEKQIDQWTEDAQDEVRRIALDRLSIDRSKLRCRRPFEVCSPAHKARWYKSKKDKKARSSRIHLTHVYLLDYYMASYRATYDLAEQAIMYDETEEFPYEEITGFGTKMVSTESIDLKEEDQVGGAALADEDDRGSITFREFVVFTRSGVSTRVPFVVARVLRGGTTTDLNDNGEKTVISLRKQLSDFKRPDWEGKSSGTKGTFDPKVI